MKTRVRFNVVAHALLWLVVVAAFLFSVASAPLREEIEQNEVLYFMGDPWPGLWSEAESILGGWR